MQQQNYNRIINGLKTFLPQTDLRQAQRDILQDFLRKSTQNITKGFFDLATGFGKTRMMNVLTESFLSQNPNGKVVVVVPTKALVRDENGDGMIKRFQDFHQMHHHEPLSIGAFYSYQKETNKNIIITTYSSLNTLKTQINPLDVGLLLLDEAHHSLSQKRIEAIQSFKNACCYGLTATPAYTPDKNLENILGPVISEMNTVQAIKDGLLSPCKNVLLSSKIKADLSGVSKNGTGEYNQEELETVLSEALKAYQSTTNAQNWQNIHELIAHEIALFYQDYVDETIGSIQGKKCMINCRSQAEARLQARALNKLFGKTVASCWTTQTKDKTILNKFVNGDLPILCQVGKLSEGFDMPELNICINYPTCSRVIEAQRSGRILRLNPENKDKFALIVDIVFTHPDFDNPILSSHANGQVLYRDITNTSIITKNSNAQDPKSNKTPQNKQNGTTQKLSLEAFNVFSDIEELITLENEAEKTLSLNHLPQKRKGMKSNTDLAKLLGKHLSLHTHFLENCYHEGKTFEVEGTPYPLVEKIKSGTHETLALHEHPKALETYMQILKKSGVLENSCAHKRKGMMSCANLAPILKKSTRAIQKILQKLYEENQTFTTNGRTKPLVEEAKNYSVKTLFLHEHPLALQKLKELLNIQETTQNTPQKREGMMSSTDLARLFKKDSKFFARYLEKLHNEEATFTINGQTYPLVEKVKSHAHIAILLHEHPRAIEKLKELLMADSIDLSLSPKREGMMSTTDLMHMFKKSEGIFAILLQKLYDEKQTFEVEGKTYPLVEKVKSKSNTIFALHEHPNALEMFKKICLQQGVLNTTKIASKKITLQQNTIHEKC